MKVVILDGATINPGDLSWDIFSEFGQIERYDRSLTEGEIISRIGDAEIILLNKAPITENVLAACPSVKLICVLATGYNVVDCDAAARRGIPVCNVPGYGTASVAQFTVALLLELCHQIGAHSMSVFRGDWTRCPDFCYWYTPQMELSGKTMGIIGFGRIGQAVGRIAAALGMKIIACSRSQTYEGSQIGEYVNLDTLLARSDVISLHCPLFPETQNLIDTDAIEKMKDGVILLNTARGPLIDECAVAAALSSGKIRAFAADVVSREPILPGNPLLSAPNCILTPHMAWAPVESRQRIFQCTVDNIRAFLQGNPINVVNNQS